MKSLGFSLIAAALLIVPANADPVADFYKGKTLSLVISSAAGGGYDALGRAVARHMARHLPGNPVIVVRNLPGAGGIVATNNLYNAAPKDGTTFGLVQNNTPFEPLFGTKEADYDATKFNWLGTPSQEVGILTLWGAAGIKTIADAKTREVTVGSSGNNSTPSFYARLLNAVLGTKLRIVVGYPGQNEAFLAMERGEIDGYPSSFWSALTSTRPGWIKDKKVELIVQYGAAPEAEIASVPFLDNEITDADDRKLVAAAVAPLAMGRPFLAPPGVPADRVAALRKALMDTFADPEFVAEADRLQLVITTQRTGEQLQQQLEAAYKTPPNIIERLRKLQQ
jgi:tripartite-type tricarboxylate transporter receptor subunit TctC